MRSVKHTLVALISSALLLALWQVGAHVLDSQILLPGLAPVFKTLVSIIGDGPFLANIGATVVRAFQSFLIIVILGSVAGVLGGNFPLFSAAMKPFVTTLKAVPVMSIILLAFIWFTSGQVPLFSAFLMGFPVMYVQVESGWRSIDGNLIQMCDLYEIKGFDRLVHFTIPSLVPSLVTGARISLSMVWKVVIAAEVLTVPRYGVGSRMQLAQVQLQTDRVLSWTLIAILLTACGDLLFELIVHAGAAVKRTVDRRRAG
ncbi:MAG TPA: ABC transporter permease subunit [Sphaerochaeta sp.]|nr:ABC transporter permease subunit [Spirochaetota bacterium]NLV60294.1 ABC transporter permease subunit [Spirochaetales bacterium]HOE85017.1 ABC transporter permease subunit [Sphaerochaeta sp.]HPY11290.1 ABC transporter permease subunit [Sphaerochaeta sp.]HQB90945.1 ABC transporter permease subunit [Sphaerochaeta sp.]